MFYFLHWGWLFLLGLVPLLILVRYVIYRRHTGRFRFSTVFMLKKIGADVSFIRRHLLFILNLLVLTLLVVGMARPQYGEPKYDETSIKGIDIQILLDVSGSMQFVDGDPEKMGMEAFARGFTVFYHDVKQVAEPRIDVAKRVLIDFIHRRTNDRMGLIVFSNFPMRLVPLTTSRLSLINELKKADFDYIGGTGKTAIGDGLGMAMVGLESSPAQSKVIILLTDGNSNKGKDPEEVAKEAAKRGIKIYTIGIGDKEHVMVPLPNQSHIYQLQSNTEILQEDILKRIASSTGGRFFRAVSEEDLQEVYRTIDALETSIIDTRMVQTKTSELFFYFVIAALMLLLLTIGLRYTVLRTIP